MDIARLAAPEIDRLVLAVNGRLGEGDPQLAREAGLDDPGFIKHFAEWLLTTGLDPEVAALRLPYVPEGKVAGWLSELEALGAVELRDGHYFATDLLAPLARSVGETTATIARSFWHANEDELKTVMAGITTVIEAAPASFTVAASHRLVPEPGDRFQALHRRLTTMRYLRAHAHVAAWRDADLNPFEIVAMTALWHGDTSVGIPGSLVQRGYVDDGRLTEEGSMVRDEIEIATNDAMTPLFAVVDDHAGLLAALRALPDEPPDLD